MKTLAVATPYGYQELRQVHQRYMMLAMLVAVTIQMMVIGGYNLSEWLTKDDYGKKPPREIKIDISIQPPPLDPTILGGSIPIAVAKLGIGRPVPNPDAAVDTVEFASQQQMSQVANQAFAQLGEIGEGTLVINEPVETKPIESWQAEKPPEPVLMVKPEYPELAQKIELEGVVVIRVLLNKEGRVEKAVPDQNNGEIFVPPALDAAKKCVFTPALMNGNPVKVWVSIPFRFKIAK